jgi:hypothetical protein
MAADQKLIYAAQKYSNRQGTKPMASLFDRNFQYTDRATSILQELSTLLSPMYEELMEEGFSPRELTVLVTHVATQTETDLVKQWEITQQVNRPQSH